MKGLALLLLLAVGTYAMQGTIQKRLMSLKGDMGDDKPELDGEFDGEGDIDFDGEDDGP